MLISLCKFNHPKQKTKYYFMNGISRLLITIVWCFLSNFGFSQKDTAKTKTGEADLYKSACKLILIHKKSLYLSQFISHPIIVKRNRKLSGLLTLYLI